jgi:3-deoxy-7-phosphoheptulonate synthase
MIIVLKPDATKAQISHILERIEKFGLKSMVSSGTQRTIIGVIGPEDILRTTPLEVFPGVEKVMPVLAPYKLVSREFKPDNSIVKINDTIQFGGKNVIVIAGPCAIENIKVLRETASIVKKGGAHILRAGAFKPRTSPYSFQGLGKDGLEMLKSVSSEFDIPTITEVMDPRDVELVCQYADILQIGARNMQNFNLLKEVGLTKKPVLLKRGLSSTVKELLMSAEYILSEGNFNVILCERGIRTFEDSTRNTLDITCVPIVKQLSHLPIIVDPSHATGKWNLVGPAAKAAIAIGSDGVLIEVHPHPEEAFSDGSQSLLPEKFNNLIIELRKIAESIERFI